MVACDAICPMIFLESLSNLNRMAQLQHGLPSSARFPQTATSRTRALLKTPKNCFLNQQSLTEFLEVGRNRPVWCGSVEWTCPGELKGHWFDSHSEHMPGVQARSLVVVVWEATDWCFSPSLSPSIPFSLKINKIFKNKRKDQTFD